MIGPTLIKAVTLYLDDNGCPPPGPGSGPDDLSLTLIGSESVPVDADSVGTLITVDFIPNVFVPAGATLIVEIENDADGTLDPTFFFRTATNDAGECGLSYLRAEPCGFPGWIALEDLGFFGFHLLQVIEAEGSCDGLCTPLTQGYWHRQCLGAGLITPGRGTGRGPQEPLEPNFDPELIACAAAFVNAGFMTCEEGMVADPPRDPCEKAEKQFTALLLNVCSGKLFFPAQLDLSALNCASTTVGELVGELSDLIKSGVSGVPGDCRHAADCAAAVNEDDGVVTLCVTCVPEGQECTDFDSATRPAGIEPIASVCCPGLVCEVNGVTGLTLNSGTCQPSRECLARIDHRFGNEGDFGRPERFSESFAIDPVQVE